MTAIAGDACAARSPRRGPTGRRSGPRCSPWSSTTSSGSSSGCCSSTGSARSGAGHRRAPAVRRADRRGRDRARAALELPAHRHAGGRRRARRRPRPARRRRCRTCSSVASTPTNLGDVALRRRLFSSPASPTPGTARGYVGAVRRLGARCSPASSSPSGSLASSRAAARSATSASTACSCRQLPGRHLRGRAPRRAPHGRAGRVRRHGAVEARRRPRRRRRLVLAAVAAGFALLGWARSPPACAATRAAPSGPGRDRPRTAGRGRTGAALGRGRFQRVALEGARARGGGRGHARRGCCAAPARCRRRCGSPTARGTSAARNPCSNTSSA